MIPTAPIDLMSAVPFDPLSYYLHMAMGLLGLVAAVVALASRKGSKPHILAGRTFAVCLLAVCATSLVMLSVRMVPPLLVGTFTALYLIATAILALKPGTMPIRVAEYGLSLMQLVVLGVFLSLAIPEVQEGLIPPIGPLVILSIPVALLLFDIRYYRQPQRRQQLRFRRHLARMIWAFMFAVRAPLIEINGTLQIPVPVILFLPLLLTPVLIVWVLRRYPEGPPSPRSA